MKSVFHFLKKSWLAATAVLALAAQPAQAQVDNYAFAASNRAYVPLPATATPVPTLLSDDTPSGALPIGFPFVFDGTPYSNAYASPNGYLSFNSSITTNFSNALNTGATTERPLIAVFWDDLDGRDPASVASYLTTGTAPNRVFTMQWLNWMRLGGSGPSFSLQVKLYETTNRVEMCYRQETNPLSIASVSIGLAGVGTGSNSFLSVSDAVSSPAVSSTVSNDNISILAPTGQVYAFTPPVPSACPIPRNLTATVSGVTATVRWTVVSGGGTFNVIYGPAGFNPATSGTTITATGNSATIGSLVPGNYQFYVQQVCGGMAGSSPLSNAGAFVVPCPSPASLAVGTLTNTTADLTWTSPLTTGATFTVIYGPSGFSPPGGTSVSGITTISTTLTGLSPATTYDAYVQQVCLGGGTGTVLAGPATFTTPLTAPGNDDPCGALALGAGPRQGNNVGATTSSQNGINLPACSPAQAPKDVWFSFTTPTGAGGNSIVLMLTGTAANMVRLFTAADCANGPFNQVGCAASTGNGIGFSGPVSFTGLVPGQRYYVAVSGYGSSDTPGAFTIQASAQATATQAQAESPALLVYPNPSATGQLALRLDAGHAAGQATLLNALGQPVRAVSLAAGTTEHHLPTTGLAAGVYTLRVSTGHEVLTRKVVLQ